MRRVFPLRPSERALLVTYDVKGDSHDHYGKELYGKEFSASSPALVCRPRRPSEADFGVSSATSGDESSAASSSSRTALARERQFASFRKPSKDGAEYPVFTGGSSCVSSPRSRCVSLHSVVEADWKGSPEDRPACVSTSSSLLLSSRDRGFKELHARLAERMQTSTQDTPCIRSNRPQAPEITPNSDEADQVPYRPPARHGLVQPTHHSRRPSLATSDKSRQSASESSFCFTKSSKRSSSLSSCSDSSSLKDDAASCKPRSTNSSFRCLSPCMLAGRVTRAWRKEKNPGQAGGKVSASATLASRKECSSEVRKADQGGVLASSGALQSPVSTGAQSMSADWLSENPVVRGEHDLPRSGRLGNPTSSGDSNLYEALQARTIAREELAAKSDMESNLWSRKLRIVSRDQCSLLEEISPKAVDVLCYEISTLCRDKKELALEVAAEIRERISDLQVAVNSLQRMETDMEAQIIETDMEAQIIAVEKDKANVQQSLENELQRRENEWAAKLEKIKREEKLMRERVLEMAEERVGLQKAIASFKAKEASWKSKMKESEVSLQILKQKSQQKDSDIADLKSALTDMSNRLNLTDSELDNSCKKNVLLEMENAELQEDLSRLQRTYEDQQLSIGELWQELIIVVNQPCKGKIASRKRLQTELLRLTEVESKLRSEVDALRSELKFLKLREGSGCPLEGGEELDLHMQTATGDVERVPLGMSPQPTWQHYLHQGSKVPCFKLRRGMENADLWHIFAVLESQRLPKDVLQRAWKALSCSFLKQEGQVLDEDVVGGSLASQLLEKLLAANKQIMEFEDQLDKREEEIELLQQQLQENVKGLSDLRMELSRVIKERDEFRSKADDITRQATRLTIEIAELRELAERLDEELMLREGQISILRGAYSESDL